MRTFTLRFEERRPFTVAVAASSLEEARRLAEEKLDTAREQYADDQTRRVLTSHTCADAPQTEEQQPSARYVLQFTAERSMRVEIDAHDPDEAEDEAREYWDSYVLDADHGGGYVLTLRSAEPESVWKARQNTPDEAPF